MSRAFAYAARAVHLGDRAADSIGAVASEIGSVFIVPSRAPSSSPDPTLEHQGPLPADATALYERIASELHLSPAERAAVASFVSARLASYGYNAPAKNFGGLRYLGRDPERSVSVPSADRPIILCRYDSDHEALTRLLTVARAATLSAPVAPLCPQCGKHDAASTSSVTSPADDGDPPPDLPPDDISGPFDDLKTAWDICKWCEKAGEKLGSVESGDVTSPVDFDPDATTLEGYRSIASDHVSQAATADELDADDGLGAVDPPPDFILDVRSKKEVKKSPRDDGAVNVPSDEISARLAEVKNLAGGARIVVFCVGGGRAARCVFMLRNAGLDACSGHKDPTCGCDHHAGPPEQLEGWRHWQDDRGWHASRLDGTDGPIDFIHDTADEVQTKMQRDKAPSSGPSDEVKAALASARSAPDPALAFFQALNQGVSSGELQTWLKNLRRMSISVVLPTDQPPAGQKILDGAGESKLVRSVYRTGGAQFSMPLADAQKYGVGALLEKVVDAVFPWAGPVADVVASPLTEGNKPTKEAEDKVQEVAAVWASIKPKMDADPKLAKNIKVMWDHWTDFYSRWQKGDKNVEDALRSIPLEANVARRSALGIDQSSPQDKPVHEGDIEKERKAEIKQNVDDKLKVGMSTTKILAIGAGAAIAAIAALKAAL